MKNIFAGSILILAFCVVSFAQTNQNLPCPTVSVLGPAGIISPGERGTFTATVSGENWEKYVYRWTIRGSVTIDENEKNAANSDTRFEAVGKNQIRFIVLSEMAGGSLLGTVEIKGLPEGCPNTASESIIFCGLQTAMAVDEFSISATQIAKTKLNNLATELQNNPSAQIYIIERYEKKTIPKAVERKNQKTIDYLKETGMDVSRFTFINGYADKTLTQIVLVPAGAAPPTCDDCITVEPK